MGSPPATEGGLSLRESSGWRQKHTKNANRLSSPRHATQQRKTTPVTVPPAAPIITADPCEPPPAQPASHAPPCARPAAAADHPRRHLRAPAGGASAAASCEQDGHEQQAGKA